MTFLSVCYRNIRTNSTYYLQHTTDWTELNVKPSRDITNTKVNSPFLLSDIGKSSSGLSETISINISSYLLIVFGFLLAGEQIGSVLQFLFRHVLQFAFDVVHLILKLLHLDLVTDTVQN